MNIASMSKRILTNAEFIEFEKYQNKHLFLAKKFSMKESIAKAFGVGIGVKLSFLDIEISKNINGKPICHVKNGKELELTKSKVEIHITSSDTKELISTHCVIEII